MKHDTVTHPFRFRPPDPLRWGNAYRDFFGDMRAIVWIFVLAVLAVASIDATAQITRPYSIRYSTNQNGDIKLIGNSLLTCPASADCTSAQQGIANPTGVNNNDWSMIDVDIDGDATTFNSSSATLSMPPGSTVLFAGLSWGARSPSVQRGQVLFKTPTTFGYSNVTASVVDPSAGSADNYGAFANVTAAVAAAGNGVYTIANVQRTLGTTQWAGWVLTVVYQNNADTLKNLVVYDGYGLVNAANPITIVASGFLTPLSGPVTTRVGASGFDGDLGLTGDGFSVNGTALTDSLNVTNNFFNSVISENGVQLPGRIPSFVNNFGVDVDRVNVPTGVVPNGATSATLQLTAPNENYHPVVITFATDLFVPIITQNVTKTVTDVNGAPLLAGDVMRWTIAMSNTGQDTGTNLILKDPIPTGTTYSPGSLVIISGANAGAKTDAVADDQADFSNVPATCAPVASPCVIYRLGTGATGAAGGNLAFGQATSLSFDTIVNAGLPAGTQITNSATISYNGQTLGATFSTISASASGTVTTAPTIAKSFAPAVVNVGGTSTLTVVLSNPASNPVSLTGVTFADTYPTGITNSATPGPNVVCSAGSTPGTVTGGVALGNTIGMTPGATILAGGNCTVTVQVIATAAGSLVNTTGNVTSTNGGAGTTASATLFVGKVSITKSFSAPTFEVGGISTITFVLTNNTGAPVTGLAFSDTYPGGMLNDAVAATNTCGGAVTATNATNLLTLGGAAGLGIGASCTITKQVVGTAGGGFTNTTTGVTRTGDAVPGNPASAPYMVVAAPTIVKTFSPNPVNVGDVTQISITITNPNATTTVARTGAVFLDTYPGGLTNTTPASVTLNCSPGSTAAVTALTGTSGGSTIGLSNMTLAQGGGTCTVTTAVVATAGDKTNPAFVATFDNAPDPTAAAAILTVTALTEPTITKTFLTNNPMVAGGTSILQIDITNTNAGTAITSVAFTDIYPAGLVNSAAPAATIAAQGGSSCTLGTVTAPANGNSLTLSGLTIGTAGTRVCRITVNVTAAARGAYVNTTGPISVANTPPGVAASGTLNVLGPPTITKSFSPVAIAVGGSSVLTIVIANPGSNPISLTGVAFIDTFPTLPAAMTLFDGITTNTCTAGSTAGTLRNLADTAAPATNDAGVRLNPGATILPNGSCTITVNVKTAATAGNYVNLTNAVVSTLPAQVGGTATATLSVARLGIAKAFAPTTIVSGGVSVITFTINNPTGAAIAGLAFTDALPAGMTLSAAAVGGTCLGVVSNAAVGVSNFAVTAGNVPTTGCTVSISVTSTVAGTNNNQSSGASYTGFPTPGAPSNIATLVVQAAPTVVKSFAPVVIAQNGTSLLTVALTNPNAVDMTLAAFTDTYPGGVTNTAAPGGTSTCPLATVTAANNGPSLAISGATIPANSTCIVTVNVTSATAGAYLNTLPAGGLTSSGGSNLSAASATLTVLLPPTVAKSFSPTGVAINEDALLTITLTNPNSTAITGAAFTDAYPVNLVNAPVPNASTTCPVGTPSAAAAGVNLTFAGGTIPANGSCTVTVNVRSGTANNYTNNTGTVTTTNAGNGTTASAILSVGVPSIAKIFSPNPVQLGQNSTLTFTITNGTPTPMANVSFTDTFPVAPGNMQVASPATFTNTCGGTYSPVALAASVSLTLGTIPADSSCTLTVVVTTPTIGTYNNTSGIVSAAGPLNGNAATASLTVTQAVPSVNKIFATNLVVGGTSLLTFTITQPATSPTQIFSFIDTLPAGLVVATPNGLGGTCTLGAGSRTAVAGTNTITFTNNQITNPATTCTLFVNVTTAAAPTISACTLAPNANTNSNVNTTTNITAAITPSATSGVTPSAGACVTVTAAIPTVNKIFSADLPVGGSTNLTFTVTQPATNPTQTFTFTDTLPAGLVASGAAVTGTCTGGSVTATAGSNSIVVTGRQIINPATACTIIVPVTTSGTPTVGACTLAPNANTNSNSNINTTTNITAAITASATSGVTPSAGACVTVNAAVPTVNKVFATDLPVGGTSNLTFTVTQPTGNPTQTFSFTDTLPAGLVASGAAVTGTCTLGTVTATAGSSNIVVTSRQIINPAATCTIIVPVTTAAAPAVGACTLVPNANTNSNINTTANITAAITPSATSGVTPTAGACVTVLANPTISKAFAAANIASGGNTNLTVTIGNTNAIAITLSVLFTDTFPGGMTIGTAGNTGTCTGVTATAAANNFTIANGTSIPAAGCTVIVNVTSSTAGAATNTIAIGALQTSAGNNAVATSATLNVYAPPTVTKTFTPAIIGFGGTSSMIITVSSTAANLANLTGVTINDAYSGTLTNAAAGAVVCSGAGSATLTGGANGGTSVGFNAGTIVPGGNCTITQSVSATSTNINTTTSPAATGPTPVTGIAANATLTVAIPTVAKTFAAAAINDGATTSLIFTLTNSGTNPAQSAITVGDTLPTGLTITSATPAVTYSAGCSGPATAAYNSGTKVLSGLTGLAMTSGTASCTVTVAGVTNTPGQTGTCPIAAQTNLTASVTTTGATNTSTDQCLTVNSNAPALTKIFTPATFADGSTTTLRFTLTNNGTNPARTGINFTDNLPSGIRVAIGGVLGSSTCTNAATVTTALNGSGVITVAGASMNNGQASCTIDVQVRNTAGQVNSSCVANPVAFTNTTTNMAGLANVTSSVTPSCVVVTTAAPTITKAFSPASISIGATSTISFTLGNTNSIALTNANFTDTLTNMAVNAAGSAAGTCVGAGGNALTAGQTSLALTGLTIPANVTCTVTVVVVSNVAGIHPNATSGVASNEAPTGAISNTANLTVNATPPTIAKAFSPVTIVSGGVSTLTITITNPNAGTITVGSVTDTFPTTPGTGVVRATVANASTTCAGGAVSSTAGSVTLTGGIVPASGTCTLQIDVTAALNGSYLNTIAANALTTNAGSNAAAASATLSVTPLANVSVTKSGPASILWGTTISYTVVVTNSGPDAANGSAFSDVVPAAISGVTATCGSPTLGAVCGAVNVAGNNVTSTITTLPTGATVTFTIQGTAPQSGTLANNATAIVPMGVSDPDDPGRTGAGNNTSNTVMTTVIAPDLQLTKTSSSGMFSVGGTGSFTLTPNNTSGTAPTTGTITVTDTLPAGLTYVAAGSGGAGWTCGNAMQVVTCTSTTVIAAGGTGNPITINVSVASNAVPGITNTALVSGGNEPPVNTGNNSAVVMVAVANVGMNTFLTDGAQTGLPGTTVLYTHVFTAGQSGSVSFATTDTPSPAIPGWTNQIYRDSNCNGVLDGAEGASIFSGSVAVNPGDQVCLIVKSNIPAAAPYNAQDTIVVTATFTPPTGPVVTYQRQDVTTVGAPGGSGLTLMKSVRNVTQGGAAGTTNTARPGDVLEYVITYTNTSSNTVMMVVISDNTPAFTNFDQASCGTPLPPALTSCNVTVQPTVGVGGNIQWTLSGLLNGGQSGTVIFRATVQ